MLHVVIRILEIITACFLLRVAWRFTPHSDVSRFKKLVKLAKKGDQEAYCQLANGNPPYGNIHYIEPWSRWITKQYLLWGKYRKRLKALNAQAEEYMDAVRQQNQQAVAKS